MRPSPRTPRPALTKLRCSPARAGHGNAPAALLLGCLLAGCASAPASLPADALPSAPGAPADSGLRVRLAFGAEADLDLYVTDPAQETVYFANTPTRSGGALEADRRCDAPAPRVEQVEWSAPPPGRYRIGIDFPIRCRNLDEPVPFVLEVSVGGEHQERRGTIAFGRFEPVVWEFDVGP